MASVIKINTSNSSRVLLLSGPFQCIAYHAYAQLPARKHRSPVIPRVACFTEHEHPPCIYIVSLEFRIWKVPEQTAPSVHLYSPLRSEDSLPCLQFSREYLDSGRHNSHCHAGKGGKQRAQPCAGVAGCAPQKTVFLLVGQCLNCVH